MDLTYKVYTYNHDGTYNSLDLISWIFLLTMIWLSYMIGKYGDKRTKNLLLLIAIILIVFPIFAMFPH